MLEFYKKHQDELDLDLTAQQMEILTNLPDTFIQSIDDMNAYISDALKTISHVISGSKSHEDLVECRINSCITKAINHYPFECDDKALIDWQSGGDFVFLGNPVLFYRVIFNLLKNALYQIKHRGQGQIFISTELSENVNLVRIKDTAGGVTNEVVSHLFQDFNTTKKEGTGIGLAFCKLTMQSFGGDITAQLVVKDCIEFVLTLPKLIRNKL